jgi:hypothetical protein
VHRDINPVWRASVVIEDIELSDKLKFTIVDSGLLSESHFGGLMGPKLVASAIMNVGQNFDGLLEMTPVHGVEGNLGPALRVSANFMLAGKIPAEGNTSVLASMFGHETLGEASAPEFERLPAEVLVTPRTDQALRDPAAEVARLSADVPDGPDSATFGRSDVMPAAADSATFGRSDVMPAAAATAGSSSSAMPSVNSRFYIDPGVFTFSPKRQTLRKLFEMQKTATKWPFPAEPVRNYNVLACGFDRDTICAVDTGGVNIDMLVASLGRASLHV